MRTLVVNKKKNCLYILSVLLLILCLAGTVFFFRARYKNTLTSDEASEMVLGNLLASEGGILSKNWYYSTEIRVLNINVLYSLFFRLTNSWHRVRLLTTVTLYLMMVITYYGMSRAYRFRSFFFLSAALLFIPFSEIYTYILLKGIHYLPFIIFSFLILAFSEFYINLNGWRANCLLAFVFIFSAAVGLGGARQLLITYIPLMTAAVILSIGRKRTRDAKKWLTYAAAAFAGSVIGFAVNAQVLSKIYSFITWSDLTFIPIDFSRIGSIISGLLFSFGYITGNVFSPALLWNGISMVWVCLTFYAIWFGIKKREQAGEWYFRFAVFLACAYVIFIAFYIFTDAIYHERYNVPITILSIPLIAMFFDRVNWKRTLSVSLFTAAVLGSAVSGAIRYAIMWNEDPNEEIRKISAFLVDEGYQNGYSSFWLANIATEFSNGVLDIWSIVSDSLDTAFLYVDDIDQTYRFLQKVSHDTTHPAGKVFLMFTAGEFVNNTWKDNLYDGKIIYRSPEFVILGYHDYEDLIDNLYPGYSFVFGAYEEFENGRDINGVRELYYQGSTHGPGKKLWPGTYEISITGENLDEANVFCAAGPEQNPIEILPVAGNDGMLKYSFALSQKQNNVNLFIENASDDPESVIRLQSVDIKRTTAP